MSYQYFNFQNDSRACCTPYRSIFICTCFSVIACLVVLALSIVDAGRASLGFNIILPILTLTYHITIFFAHRRFQDAINDGSISKHAVHPTATTAALVCVYSLMLLWYLPFGLLIGLHRNDNRKWDHNTVFSDFSAANPVTLGLQIGLDSGISGLFASMAANSTSLRVMADKRARAEAISQMTESKA